ncbi:MAG TPA: helix-turn-helix domain-containing protein [Candidatus Aminicenantes bacterium]|nr:helix-turn-helix domain-containing protein [Candidatus Aminicenantes bacterium]
MTPSGKKIAEIAEQFEALSIQKQMKIVAHRAVQSGLFYNEVLEEFERTLLQAFLDKFDGNQQLMALHVKLHRNTLARKMKKWKLKVRKPKAVEKAT